MPTPFIRSCISVFATVLLAVLPACGKDSPQPPAPREISASTDSAVLEEAVECRSFAAQVESRNSVTLASKVSGAVVEVAAQEGAFLKAGSLILKLDDKDLQSREQGFKASMAQAASEREATAAKVSHAKSNLDRLSKLVAQKVISQDDFEKARTEYLALSREEEAISARERAVAAQMEELKALWAYTRVAAPFDGVLTRRYVDLGAFVNAGQPLAQMDDAESGFDLTAQVDESLLASVAAGQQVVAVIPAISTQPFAARVSAVVGRVDPATRTFKIKVEIPKLEQPPRAGMFGRLFLPARTSRKVLLPEGCLAKRGDIPAVFALDGKGVASLRVVKPGGRFVKVMLDGKPYLTDSEAFGGKAGEGFVEVLSGLSGGERLACSALDVLREGDRVKDTPSGYGQQGKAGAAAPGSGDSTDGNTASPASAAGKADTPKAGGAK